MNHTVFIKTYGCQMNERESEAIAADLSEHGYRIVDHEKDADIILLNTCSVRELAELKAIGKSNFLAKDHHQIIGIIGCMAQNLGPLIRKKSPSTSLVVGPTSIAKIPEYLDQLIHHKTDFICDTSLSPIDENISAKHDISKIKTSMFVSIMQGCNMHCSYCIVPKTRGPEQYRQMQSILDEIQFLADHGTKEVTLLGQIVNSYGIGMIPFSNGKSPFVQLLEKIQNIHGIERIRFTSPHPKGFKEDLIDAYKNLSKLCPYVHLPLQSGSNQLLKAMRRPYTRESFLSIVDALRQRVPSISISTDIIVGFPGETEEDFQQTCEIFDTVQFDMAFIFKYSIRPGTLAESFDDQIPDSVKEERNQILLKKLEKFSTAYNQRMEGKIYPVLVEKTAKRGVSQFEGRTPEHKKVIFQGDFSDIGNIIPVKILASTSSTLTGEKV